MRIFPETLLCDICWDFAEHRYENIHEFNMSVAAYQREVSAKNTWQPDMIAIDAPQIRIYYEVWEETEKDDDDNITKELMLIAKNTPYLTQGELFFQLHNALAQEMSRRNHSFFDGLYLLDHTMNENIPCYMLRLGS